MANLKNITRRILNEQGQGFNCEGTCECITPVFGSGTYQTETDCINDTNCCKKWDCYSDGTGACEAVNNINATFDTEADCLAQYPTGCTPRPDTFDCLAKTGFVCANLGPSGGGTFTTMGDCTNAFPNGCQPVDDKYECEMLPGTQSFSCVLNPGGSFTGPTALADCQTAVANNVAPCNVETPRDYTCDLENCACVIQPGGPFTGPTALADCNAALSNPAHECCCRNCDPKKYKCVRKGTENPKTKGDTKKFKGDGRSANFLGMLKEQVSPLYSCVEDPTGTFNTMGDCQACVQDPMCEECNERGGDGFDCLHGNGGCQAIDGGQYSSMADCEASTDDHYNFGDFCDCECPGQPAGCDAANLMSPVPIINMEFQQNGGQGLGGQLDLNHDSDSQGPLLTSAFRTRMAPCGPSYSSPNVSHDCKFWEYISTKKLPIDVWNQKVMQPNANSNNNWHTTHNQTGYPWTQGPGPGGQATTSTGLGGFITNQGNVLNPLGSAASQTPHPRWQRRVEAKIAYVRCLRAACCKNTDWPNDGQVFTPSL